MTPRPSARACAITVLSCALCTGCLLRYELDERVRDRTQKDLDAQVTSIDVTSIGGFILSGIVGLFVGAVVLALGYDLFTVWLHEGDTEALLEESGIG